MKTKRLRYVGIDQSLCETGVCIMRKDETFKSLLLTTPKHLKEEKRLAWIREQLAPVIEAAECVAMEGYSYASFNRIAGLAELGGMIKMMCFDAKTPLIVVAPMSLKKFVQGTGKGKGGKDLMLLGIYKKWKAEFNNNNLADAYALAHFVRKFANTKARARALSYEKECITACHRSPLATLKFD